jgi:hypothetical protein
MSPAFSQVFSAAARLRQGVVPGSSRWPWWVLRTPVSQAGGGQAWNVKEIYIYMPCIVNISIVSIINLSMAMVYLKYLDDENRWNHEHPWISSYQFILNYNMSYIFLSIIRIFLMINFLMSISGSSHARYDLGWDCNSPMGVPHWLNHRRGESVGGCC